MSKYPEEQIRNYAHRLWEKAGRPEGKSEEFWRQAENELDAEGARLSGGRGGPPTIFSAKSA